MAQLRTASWARVPWMTSSTCPPNSASRPVPGPLDALSCPAGQDLVPARPPGAHQDLVPTRPAPACAQRLPPGHPLAQTLELMRELSAGAEPAGPGLSPELPGGCASGCGVSGSQGLAGEREGLGPSGSQDQPCERSSSQVNGIRHAASPARGASGEGAASRPPRAPGGLFPERSCRSLSQTWEFSLRLPVLVAQPSPTVPGQSPCRQPALGLAAALPCARGAPRAHGGGRSPLWGRDT